MYVYITIHLVSFVKRKASTLTVLNTCSEIFSLLKFITKNNRLKRYNCTT